MARAVDITVSGGGVGLVAYGAYCPQARRGIMFTDPTRQKRVVQALVRLAGEVLGEPTVLGKLTDETDRAHAQLLITDAAPPIPTLPKGKSRGKPKLEWKQKEWGQGW